MRKTEMIGKKFGQFLVLKEVEKKNNKRAFLCRCSCKKEYIVMGDNLRSGNSTQCMSCSSKIKGGKYRTHGMTNTRVFKVWAGIKDRCRNTNCPLYKNYGGRGISVCDRWFNSFEAFLKDMGEPPSLKHQIDREDNDGNYEPGNCRWVTSEVQQNNRRNNVLIEHNGRKKTLSQWATCLGVGVTTLRWRLLAGWPPEKILSVPVRQKGRIT